MRSKLFVIAFLAIHIFYAQTLKSPSEFLGYELGSHFSRHHQVVDYYKYVAQTVPDRVRLTSYGKTYEGRELLVVMLSSAANMADLENIREEHLRSTRGEGDPSKAIVWLSYNVHGNESVSTEASMQTLYALLTEKQSYLENTVVIIDPCLNPDGRDRYVNWYNQNKNTPYTIDPNSKEHNEGWLSGRSNHYMFDLNRDWAWLTQTESRQRLKLYNQWLPHIHVDFHEQGVDNPYYFAPAAEPQHEVITNWQKEFQVTTGKNHARYFDANGWLYFTREYFDLLYPSYGDTYPTYNGSIGMTYEQGGSGRAGLGIRTSLGDTLTLNDRISHHFTTGISTVEVASQHADELNKEFRNYFVDKNYRYKSYVLNGDEDRLRALTDLLDAHEIRYGFTDASQFKGYDFSKGKTANVNFKGRNLVVNTDQVKGTLVKVLLEPQTKLTDSLTYDITAWSLPYAYGLDAVALEKKIEPEVSGWADNAAPDNGFDENAYAYVIRWNSMEDARFLSALLNEKIKVRLSRETFSLHGKSFDRGSLIITRSDNRNSRNFGSELKRLAGKFNRKLHVVSTGFVDGGKDFGSDSVSMIPEIKVAVLSGRPFSTLGFGEIWHFFEQQLNYPVTVIDTDYLDRIDLSAYDVLILPSMEGSFEEGQLNKIDSWTNDGGRLIAIGNAVEAIAGNNGFNIIVKKSDKKDEKNDLLTPVPYISGRGESIKNMITGAIYKARVDNTNPLAYGYGDTYYTLKLDATSYDYLAVGNAVYLEDKNEPLSGFAGSEALKKQSNSLVIGNQRHGRGTVVYMVDNPLFRGFWENGKLFFVNALFMLN